MGDNGPSNKRHFQAVFCVKPEIPANGHGKVIYFNDRNP